MTKRKLNVEIGNYSPRGSMSDNFMSEMKSYPYLIKYARNEENGLDVQFRGGYINIYYKGGNLINLSGKNTCKFDEDYFYIPDADGMRMTDIKRLCSKDYLSKKDESKFLSGLKDEELLLLRNKAQKIRKDIKGKRDKIVKKLKQCDSVESVAVVVNEMKETMDKWKDGLRKRNIRKDVIGERTIQHNISLFNKKFDDKTDFVVLDIEYAISTNASYAKEYEREKQPRIDILSIEKNTGQLYVMELKYGMKSVGGEASAKKHYDDYLASVGNDNKWHDFLKDIEILLDSKYRYGIMDEEINIADSKPVFAFIMKKENDSDEASFREHLKNNSLSFIPTLYLPCDEDPYNPSVTANKLSKTYIK